MIYLVRHGETEWNLAGRAQGRKDSPLTDLGRRQAARMGAQLAALKAEAGGHWTLTASPLGRAQASAEIIAQALDLPVTLDERLVEVGFGAWEGLTRAEINARHPEVIGRASLFMAAPDGETYEALESRLSAWLSEIDLTDGVHRVVVTHGGAGRVLRALYGGVPREDLHTLPVPQDAFYRFAHGRIETIPCPAETPT